MTLQELWNIVNNAQTLDEIENAKQQVIDANIDVDDTDELLNTLAYLSREAYRRKH